MGNKIQHPDWTLAYKKPGTELKRINGRYYLYGVKSVYDKTTKRSKKISLGILGSITEEKGFVPSEKRKLKAKSAKTYHNKKLFTYEYGFSKWLFDTLKKEGTLEDLKKHFPHLWQFIIMMVFCRTAHNSPLKNIPFFCEQSNLCNLLDWKENMSDKKISDLLFILGTNQHAIHTFLQPKNPKRKTVLINATEVALQSRHIALSPKRYDAQENFQPQFVLFYLYDATSLKPLYYKLLPGNIRRISAIQDTKKISGMEQCVYIADKGFFSESNVSELEQLGTQFIIPLKRDNALVPYHALDTIEQTDNYFKFANRFIFYAETLKEGGRNINMFMDGKLKEQEKKDYLKRIGTFPERNSKLTFNEKLKTMGTIPIIHNTDLSAQEVYREYKNRVEIEQFFDHLKNTLDAPTSHIQREESLNGWMFINHLSMQIIYTLDQILKTTPLNKKHKLNHKYSINDTIEHLKSIQKIQFSPQEYVISEVNKLTKTLLKKIKISIA